MYEGENILISSQKSPAYVSRENIFYGELEKHLHGGVCIPMHSDSQQCACDSDTYVHYTRTYYSLYKSLIDFGRPKLFHELSSLTH